MRQNISVTLAVALAFLVSAQTAAEDGRVEYQAEIDADIDAVWKAFTTGAGLQSWMAPLAEIELVVGGKMKANYNAEGEIGDSTTIENTILSFDPKRMLSLKATKFPEGFPFEETAKATWSVFYFSELPSSRTKVTVVGLGYSDTEPSRRMREFFAIANKQLLDRLNESLKKQRANAPQ
ncbi:MAG: hypothetical protein KatS3mg111_4320 [Pirellulaceae bacterium]|nr:MAG: hypothetical protein KatS3mg111_4320 [Pirellulaceae bacterium]